MVLKAQGECIATGDSRSLVRTPTADVRIPMRTLSGPDNLRRCYSPWWKSDPHWLQLTSKASSRALHAPRMTRTPAARRRAACNLCVSMALGSLGPAALLHKPKSLALHASELGAADSQRGARVRYEYGMYIFSGN